MTANPTPLPVSNQAARRFFLDHQFLLPPRQIQPDEIIPQIFKRLGCIQFDTINVVGRNADLVLQSRVKGYTPDILSKLLYEDRKLIDGWDKMASIYPTADWVNFTRRREAMHTHTENRSQEAIQAIPGVLTTIKENGPTSSIEIKDDRKTDWWWAPTSVTRAAMEALFARGDLGIDHRVNTRRVFDLIERLMPEEILNAPDPHSDDQDYLEWHLLRRIGSMGLGPMSSGESWGGIYGGRKVVTRRAKNKELVEKGVVTAVSISNLPGQEFFIRTKDLPNLEIIPNGEIKDKKAAFIAPLDNLMWNRKFIEQLFGFSYTWEVYKPKKIREYGYYVLPVIYGDRFIARVDMKIDRKTNILNLIDWWWEDGTKRTPKMEAAIREAFRDFLAYLGGDKIKLVRENFVAKRQLTLFEALTRNLR